MRRLLRFILPGIICFAADLPAQTPQKYWVQFTDKNNSPYSISNPSAYLGSRALTRRTSQGIAIDSLDLPVNPAYVSGVAATGVSMLGKSKWLNGVIIFTNDTNALLTIQSLPYVSTMFNVGREREKPQDKFNETFSETIHNQRTGAMNASTINYGPSFTQINMLGGVCLHNAGFLGQGMHIAVIDAGFWSVDTVNAFDSLWTNNRILGTWDFVQNNASVYEDDTHGMMVLSCMGGNLPGQVVGTAPEASYWLLRSEEAATEHVVEEYLWSAAAEFADSVGADVINSSLGYTQFDNPAENHVFATDMNGNVCPSSVAADFAASRGIAVVVSAGNSGSGSWRMIGAPADADSALAIGAVDSAELIAGFSSHGFSADGDVKPNVCAQGSGAVVAAPGGGTWNANGTSFSSPITAGLVACLWQAHPNMTNMQVLQNIEMSADRFGNPDTLYGYGIPDFCAANITLGGTGGMNFNEGDQISGVGPNPFTDKIEFSYFATIPQQIHVELYDIRGRMLMHEILNAQKNSVNRFSIGQLETVEQGLYLLRITSATGEWTHKLVKK
ncbi:MAG: peptidase S8 and S53 subtilisin kexin sedolisin [Bacteroidetes bacterium]|nr:MAG: peptidase S8 and S53 subtilisin kexin sedolisin [Bacteroidota bacterium]